MKSPPLSSLLPVLAIVSLASVTSVNADVPPAILGAVAGSDQYDLIYQAEIPAEAPAWAFGADYVIDHSLTSPTEVFDRVAYVMELDDEWVWVSFDTLAQAQTLATIGVPTVDVVNGVPIQSTVNNMDVFSSITDANIIATGTGLAGGNIEFWPSNYGGGNGNNIPNADDALFDWGDSGASGDVGYGAMQVHNHEASQVIFAFNRWGAGDGVAPTDLGIGSSPGAQPDYTFDGGGQNYAKRNLYVLVRGGTPAFPSPEATEAVASLAGDTVLLTFSEALSIDSVDIANFSIEGGPAITAADLSKNTVALTTSGLVPGTAYTVNYTGVAGLPGGGVALAETRTIGFTAPAFPAFPGTIPAAEGYELIYHAEIPEAAPAWGDGASYLVDQSPFSATKFDRVAYLLELGGEWVFVSFDVLAQASSLSAIGIPTVDVVNGAPIQTKVSNMDVSSSIAGITTGTGLSGGNIEFWPGNYNGANDLDIPNASPDTLDFGDGGPGAGIGYGSMQIHNHEASEVLFAFNRWGGGFAGTTDIGIGTNTVGGQNPDYTFAENAASFASRNLYVLVRPTSVEIPVFIADAVPESRNYKLVYELDIPAVNEFGGDDLAIIDAYTVDNSASLEAGSRVAYVMELDDEWVWVSFDAFEEELDYIGIPHKQAWPSALQEIVTNMKVFSNSPQVTPGFFNEGNIEFWGGNYGPGNGWAIPNADENTLDFGDTMGGDGGHGCMQVHNFERSEVIFAYNNWGSNNPGATGGLGIGTNPNALGAPDWTFEGNSDSYSKRKLYVLVGDPPAIPKEIHEAVEESIQYEVVYQLDIPAVNEFSGDAQTISDAYEVDHSIGTLPGEKVAYVMVLDDEWVWVSFDSVTDDLSKIGIPHMAAWPEALQQRVNNLNVVSNVDRLTTGLYSEGNIEFWGGDYGGENALGIPNADASWDFGDTMSAGGGHGCMQVHNFEESEVVFAYNNWGSNNPGTAGGLGIGSNPDAAGQPDWTIAGNSGSYGSRTLYVLVGDASGNDDPDGDGISNPLEIKHGLDPFVADADSDNDGDGVIASVEIFELGTLANVADTDGDGSNDGAEGIAGTDPLDPDTDGDGLLDGVETDTGNFVNEGNTGSDPLVRDTDGDGFSDAAEVIAGFNPVDAASVPVSTLPLSIASKIPGILGFELIYEMQLPGVNEFRGEAETINAAYSVNRSALATGGPRVAYLLVLDDQWVWASFDSITDDLALIGIPHMEAWPEALQQTVSNLEVLSNADPGKLTQGTWDEGNIEFWGGNYAPGNALGIDNADDATFDFGDTMAGGGHACMQVHNFVESQVVFAYNNWGSLNPGATGGLGIGTNPGGNPDYTFQGNSGSYTTRTLYVFSGEPGGSVSDDAFEITSVSVDSATSQVTVTWPSSEGETFSIEWSADLVTYTQLEDELEGGAGSTSYVDTVPAGTRVRYYRVSKEQ